MSSKTINAYAMDSSNGTPVFEEVLVFEEQPDLFLVLSSPGLASGFASGDYVKFVDELGNLEVVKRGGNLCIQLYYDFKNTVELSKLFNTVVEKFGGSVDAVTDKVAVFSIDVGVGFNPIEQVFDAYTIENTESEWNYANVYCETDGITPLNWWTT